MGIHSLNTEVTEGTPPALSPGHDALPRSLYFGLHFGVS